VKVNFLGDTMTLTTILKRLCTHTIFAGLLLATPWAASVAVAQTLAPFSTFPQTTVGMDAVALKTAHPYLLCKAERGGETCRVDTQNSCFNLPGAQKNVGFKSCRAGVTNFNRYGDNDIASTFYLKAGRLASVVIEANQNNFEQVLATVIQQHGQPKTQASSIGWNKSDATIILNPQQTSNKPWLNLIFNSKEVY
jgi:hypothetical protein